MIRRSREEIAADMRKTLAQGASTGAEYAMAAGIIGAIRNPGRYGTYAGLTDAEKLTEIGEVLAALDDVTQDGAL